MTDNPLARIPVITQAILDAQPLTKHVEQLDYLEGLTFMAQKIGAALETKNEIGEALVRICRNAGLRLSSEFTRGGDGSNQYQQKEQSISRKRLAECGFNDWRANVCRKIAALPEDDFEDLILSIRLGEHKEYTEINMKNFRVAGEIHLMRIRGISTDRPQRLEPEAKIDLKFAEYMFWIGVDWEGGVNQSARCNVDAEIQTAIKEWKEQAP